MNKKEALALINKDKFLKIPAEFWKDRSFVLEAVKINGLALKYADNSFKKDKEIVLEAVKQDADSFVAQDSLKFADESLKKDPDIIKAAKNR